jgi:hypothetical protein
MENQQDKEQQRHHDNTIGGAQTNIPDGERQNETGYAGTTNSLSENHQESDAYQIAPEDTMIGYDGNEEQLNMDLGEDDRKRSGKTGIDDNS